MTAATPFETQMAALNAIYKQHGRLNSGMVGELDPGTLAKTVFGDNLESGQLFLYLFRRFGAPINPIDDYKQCASYTFTTPRPDVWLYVTITATNSTNIQFGYCILPELAEHLDKEYWDRVEAWHQEKERWCREQGMDLPVIPPRPMKYIYAMEGAYYKAFFSRLNAQKIHAAILEEAYSRYTLAHPEKVHELHNEQGMLCEECHNALMTTLRDLTRPTYCRDIYFTSTGRVADAALEYDKAEDITLYHGQSCAGYIPPDAHLTAKELVLARKAAEDTCVWFGSLECGDYCPICDMKIDDSGSGHIVDCPYPSLIAWDQFQAKRHGAKS